MKRIDYTKKFIVDPDLKEKHYFQVLGDEMMLWFPEKDTPMIWATLYKNNTPIVERAFRICQDKGITNLRYLQAIVRNT